MKKSSTEDSDSKQDDSLSSPNGSPSNNFETNIYDRSQTGDNNNSDEYPDQEDDTRTKSEKSHNEEDEVYETTKKDEQYRLGGRPPLITLCSLISGPLLSQISQSFYILYFAQKLYLVIQKNLENGQQLCHFQRI